MKPTKGARGGTEQNQGCSLGTKQIKALRAKKFKNYIKGIKGMESFKIGKGEALVVTYLLVSENVRRFPLFLLLP